MRHELGQLQHNIYRPIAKYVGTVMTSFDYTITPTRGKWLQTKQPEHELVIGSAVTSMRVCGSVWGVSVCVCC